ncbi:MAG: hypothetical protein ACI8TX_003233 [Hyphomicrobiaceae bacterium]|jgi:hypothetical protein
MSQSKKALFSRIVVISAIFAFGFLAGSVNQNNAEAQFGDALKAAGAAAAGNMIGTEGALGTAAKLATSITEMQESVDTLQRNLETLNTLKAALGG